MVEILDGEVTIKLVKCTFDFRSGYVRRERPVLRSQHIQFAAKAIIQECTFIEAVGVINTGGAYGMSPPAEIINCDFCSVNALCVSG